MVGQTGLATISRFAPGWTDGFGLPGRHLGAFLASGAGNWSVGVREYWNVGS